MKNSKPLLEIKDLHIEFQVDRRKVQAVNGVNLKVMPGQSVGIVGESGCGKTVTTYSVLQILARTARIAKGEINFSKRDGSVVDIAQMNSKGKEIRSIRGGEISMVFQEPMTTLSPVHTIGNQMIETIMLHQDITKEEARSKAIELLGQVGISKSAQRIDAYSFQFSGGMRQRAMIALALACNPALLLADEPTSALDVTIQAQVLQLMRQLQHERGLSMVIITHDLGVVAHMVDHLYVMYLGMVVEEGPVVEIFDHPSHPYTRDLLESIPRLSGTKGKLKSIHGSVPDYLPTGCPFHTRCQSIVGDICRQQRPAAIKRSDGHFVSCHLYAEGGQCDDRSDAQGRTS